MFLLTKSESKVTEGESHSLKQLLTQTAMKELLELH